MVNDQRNVGKFLIHIRVAQVAPGFANHAVLAKKMPVIGGNDDHGVIHQAKAFHFIEQLPKPVIHQADFAGIQGADFFQFFRAVQVGLAVGWPDESLPGVAGIVHFTVREWRVEGLVRIEDFQQEEEIFLIAVPLHPLGGFPEDLGSKIIFFHAEMSGISLVTGKGTGPQGMTGHPVGITGVFKWNIWIGNPQVIFLPADKFCAGEVEEIIAGAALPHVIVVADDHAGMPVLRDNLGDIGVAGFQGPPAAPGKLKAARPHIPAGRHAWVGPQVSLVEDNALLRQRIKMGGLDPVVAVTTQVVAAQRINQDENRIHKQSSKGVKISWWAKRVGFRCASPFGSAKAGRLHD